MSRAYTKGFATELKAANQTPTQKEKLIFRLLDDIILFIGQLMLPPWADPPPSDTMEYGQQAGGTHPTGMDTFEC